ncbi:MAG TPA: glycosyltransferase family 4 protein [Thermoleophilia bacterium]|nr:glycosyltransferase family 4 protein [Thermoleophilia bacterium]
MIGNYIPRRCGIATFTTDLAESLAAEAPESEVWAAAMNDTPEGYPYPSRVHFEMSESSRGDYLKAAEFLNICGVEVASLQHEYGIFGGPAGEFILDLIGQLRMPVVTTLHTVLREPTRDQMRVSAEIARLSAKLVVMSRRAASFLRDIYQVPAEKIAFIHHGVPDLPFTDPTYYKDQFGVEGRTVAATFGLLSANKGIEHMIAALPEIVEHHPDFMYLVLGATHPNVQKHEGERYRTLLERLAVSLGVAEHVRFLNRFVDLPELCEFLGCADVYVTPYGDEAQITSGTLAYAMASGKAIVSTPYWYATEMLAEERGVITPFGDTEALTANVLALLSDPVRRHAMRKRAYVFTRDAVWSKVAQEYLNVFAEAKERQQWRPTRGFRARAILPTSTALPEINLAHLRRMSDGAGLLRHATFNLPDRAHGYCTDDNARALVLTVSAQDLLPGDEGLASMSACYLGFLSHALDPGTGRFRNFMSYDRRWEETEGSEDTQGRALWALGVTVAHAPDEGQRAAATSLFHRALSGAEALTHPRASALALVGIHAYLGRFAGDTGAKRVAKLLARRILHDFKRNATDDWYWFEDILTFDNGKVAQALLLAGTFLKDRTIVEVGVKALEWLTDMQFANGMFRPVGNCGWYRRGGLRARFDQQPIEAQSMIEVYASAYAATGETRWADLADQVFQWYLGQNDLGVPIWDSKTGACCDGLGPEGPNLNQGAESTLAWLLSLTHMHKLRTALSVRSPALLQAADRKNSVSLVIAGRPRSPVARARTGFPAGPPSRVDPVPN